jgi:hypothetical protein
MGEAHEMPQWLDELNPRFKVARHAILAIGAVSVGASFRLAPDPAAGEPLPAGAVRDHALRSPATRFRTALTSPFFSWFGLFGCLVLVFFIPPLLLAVGAISLGIMYGGRWMVQRR